MRLSDWFLTEAERGNPATTVRAWTSGNFAEPLVHGAEYFRRLVEAVATLRHGDLLCFTDWRGDPDEVLAERTVGDVTVAGLLGSAAERGVIVRGLVWRSHLDQLSFSERENRHVGDRANAAGGEVLLDERVRRGGSHHQKLVVVRPYDPTRAGEAVAFAGGIDLCHSRRDDADHAGDPQPQPMAEVYGPRPPWHDVQVAVRGPAVADIETSFRERWEDPAPLDHRNPYRLLLDQRLGQRVRPSQGLPPPLPDPPEAGPHAVQVLRTYPERSSPYPFAPHGERSIAKAYMKALRRARRLIYVEDQYMWSVEVAALFARALADNPRLHLVVVVPRYPDQDGRLALPPNLVGRDQALEVFQSAGGDRVSVYDVESPTGMPVYVHAKVCVVDDIWATIGSDNMNRRSWTHDSELDCAVVDETLDGRSPQDPGGLGDGARTYARDLRLRLWREHLDWAGDDAELVDPEAGVAAMRRVAARLQAWYDGGRRGERPPGRIRPHRPERLPRHTRLWALPAYRLFCDPDGRSWRERRAGRW